VIKAIKNFRHKFAGKKTVIAVAAIALLVCTAVVYTVLANKSPRSFYLESEGKNFKKYSDEIKKAYKDFYAEKKPYMENKYKTRTEFTADIRSESEKPFGIPNAKNIMEFIRKGKLIIDTNNNPASKESMTRLSLLLEKSPLLDATFIARDGTMDFTIPVLLPDKYFSFNTDRMDDIYNRLYKRYNLPDIKPKRAVKPVDIAKTIKFSEQELDNIIKDYGAFISGLIDEKDVKYGENVTLNIGGETIKGREIKVDLNGDKTSKFLREIMDKAGSDDTLLKLTYENYADIAQIFDEAGLFQLYKYFEDKGYLGLNDTLKGFINHLNVKKDIDLFKSNIKKFADDTSFKDGMKMVLVVDKSGNILDRKVELSCAKADGENIAVSIHTGTNDVRNDNFRNGIFSIGLSSARPDGVKLEQVWNVSTNLGAISKNGEEKGKIDIGYSSSRNGADVFSVQGKLDIDRKFDEQTFKNNSLIKYEISFKGNDPGVTDKFTGELNSSKWKNNKLKTTNANTSFVLNMDLPSMGLKDTTVKLGLTNEDRLDVDFSLPEIQPDKRIDINNISDGELEKVEAEAMASLGMFYIKNRQIVDALLGY